ncbi:hypothetical protein DV515_00001508, partial [Chloebia gouldiae]
MAVVAGLILVSITVCCCYCCYCRRPSRSRLEEEEEQLARKREERRLQSLQRKHERKLKHDEIRKKYGVSTKAFIILGVSFPSTLSTKGTEGIQHNKRKVGKQHNRPESCISVHNTASSTQNSGSKQEQRGRKTLRRNDEERGTGQRLNLSSFLGHGSWYGYVAFISVAKQEGAHGIYMAPSCHGCISGQAGEEIARSGLPSDAIPCAEWTPDSLLSGKAFPFFTTHQQGSDAVD